MEIIHEDPTEEAARLKRNEEKVEQMMRVEANFWLKVIGYMMGGIVVLTVLIANL